MIQLFQQPFLRRFAAMANAFQRANLNALERGTSTKTPLEVLLEMHRKNRQESFFYRLVDRRWILPVTSFLNQCKSLNEDIKKKGIFEGSKRFLEKLGLQLKVVINRDAKNFLSKNFPLLLIGEHPSALGFDFFALAASMADISNRTDNFHFLGWLLARGIIPSFQSWIFPVSVTAEEFGTPPKNHGHFGPFADWVQACALPINRYQSARFNKTSIKAFAQSWINGNRVLLFPDGGTAALPVWRPGLGWIVIEAVKNLRESQRDFYILFFRVEGANDRMVLNPPLIARYHPFRLIFRPKRKSMVVRYGTPIHLNELQSTFFNMKPMAVTELLQKMYKEQFKL